MTKTQKKARLAMIKRAAKKIDKKNKMMDRLLAKQVKKSGELAPSKLEAFEEKNMYWSERETMRYLESTDYIDNYKSMRSTEEWN